MCNVAIVDVATPLIMVTITSSAFSRCSDTTINTVSNCVQRLRPCLEAELRRRRVVIVSNTWAIEGLEPATEGRVGKQGVFYIYRSTVEGSETERGDMCPEGQVDIGEGGVA